MAGQKRDHYTRLITFVVDGCSNPQRELFLQKAISDTRPGVRYTTMERFLDFHQTEIDQMRTNKLIRDDQLNLIFPPHGPTDINKWDVTLVSTLLQKIFDPLPSSEKRYIGDIRDVRNDLCHKADTAEIDDQEFRTKWTKLENAANGLAQCIRRPTFQRQMSSYIQDLRYRPLPPAGPVLDVLKQWYATDMRELREDVHDIQEGVSTTNAILEQVVHKSFYPSGAPNKRLKVADPITLSMEARFADTYTHSLPDDFVAPQEETDMIRSKLKDHHRVVVSGPITGSPIQLPVALNALKDTEHKRRCVQLTDASDWRHINGDDVDLVLFVHPFGEDQYDKKKAPEMNDIFDEVFKKTEVEDIDSRIYVVVVTYRHVLERYYSVYGSHKLLDQVVEINRTDQEPILIPNEKFLTEPPSDPVMCNLIEHTRIYMQHMRHEYGSSDVIDKACEMFRKHKMITIVGPKRSGKTTLAVNILRRYAYEPKYCLVLTNPFQWQHVRMGDMAESCCVILIEDFAGKYMLDVNKAAEWFTVFDMMLAAVKEKKLNVIITCDETHFETCMDENHLNSPHEILKHCLTLTAENAPDPSDSSIDTAAEVKIEQEDIDAFNNEKDKTVDHPAGEEQTLTVTSVDEIQHVVNGDMLEGDKNDDDTHGDDRHDDNDTHDDMHGDDDTHGDDMNDSDKLNGDENVDDTHDGGEKNDDMLDDDTHDDDKNDDDKNDDDKRDDDKLDDEKLDDDKNDDDKLDDDKNDDDMNDDDINDDQLDDDKNDGDKHDDDKNDDDKNDNDMTDDDKLDDDKNDDDKNDDNKNDDDMNDDDKLDDDNNDDDTHDDDMNDDDMLGDSTDNESL